MSMKGYRMKGFSMALDGVIAIRPECRHTACFVMGKVSATFSLSQSPFAASNGRSAGVRVGKSEL
jgi:hypothetical protein